MNKTIKKLHEMSHSHSKKIAAAFMSSIKKEAGTKHRDKSAVKERKPFKL